MTLNDDIFGDLGKDDDLGASRALPHGEMKRRVLSNTGERWQASGPAIHKDKCEDCKGTGRFRSWAGRDIGACFKCKGQGFRMFKTSAESRRIAREKTTERKVRAREEFEKANPEVIAWLRSDAARQRENELNGKKVFDLSIKFLEAFEKWNGLTDRQLGVATEMMKKSNARKAQWAAEKAQRDASAKSIDVSRIEEAFKHARANARKDREGIKWLRLNLDVFTFSDAPANGQWPACIFVKQGSIKLGQIRDGKFFCSNECNEATEEKVIEVASDPFKAAKAFGQRTGVCCCCGRELTNEASRKAGIGPICATKHGWVDASN